jgi:hypothetical protein
LRRKRRSAVGRPCCPWSARGEGRSRRRHRSRRHRDADGPVPNPSARTRTVNSPARPHSGRPAP